MSNKDAINVAERVHFLTTVGKTVRDARESAGVAQGELAKRAGVASSTLFAVEDGRTCSLLCLTKIANALDTTLDALVPLEALR
jgi:DNA-binding XRE family transcriptional regulator